MSTATRPPLAPTAPRSARREIGVTHATALRGLVVLMLFWYLGPVGPFMPPELLGQRGVVAEVEEQLFLRLSWVPIYLVTLLLAFRRLPAVWRAAIQNPLILALLLLPLASAAWSLSPGMTVRRGVALAFTSLFGLLLAVRFERSELIRLLGWAFAAIMVSSVLVVLAMPEVGISGPPHPGAWRGVFPQKNGLGQRMLLALLTFLVLAAMSRDKRWPLGFAAAAAALLALSTSKTAVVVGGGLVPVGLLAWRIQRQPERAGYLIGLAVAGAAAFPLVVFVALEPTLALLGRDLTLTGRTEIWQRSWDAICQRPLLGYGYGSFWTAPEGPALDISFLVGWKVPSAHNGYLDLLLTLGALGLLVFGMLFVRTMVRTLRSVRRDDRWGIVWSVCFVTFFVAYAFSESIIMEHHTANWVLFVAVATYAGQSRRARAARRP